MTKPLAADSKLFLALSSCDVPRDLADRVQQRCKLPDVVAAANLVVIHSRADQWQTRAKELAFKPGAPGLKDLVRMICQEIVNQEYPTQA